MVIQEEDQTLSLHQVLRPKTSLQIICSRGSRNLQLGRKNRNLTSPWRGGNSRLL
ncbi:hypothetical protein Bca101_062194 [Brassica carinata]